MWNEFITSKTHLKYKYNDGKKQQYKNNSDMVLNGPMTNLLQLTWTNAKKHSFNILFNIYDIEWSCWHTAGWCINLRDIQLKNK